MNFKIIINNANFIFEGVLVTLKVTLLSFLFSLVIGIIVGTLRSSKTIKGLNSFFTVYVELIRGTPLLIQLFFIYYGLPSINITMSSFFAAILGLSLNSGAYISEIIRGSILAVDYGQKEAAKVLGYNTIQSYLHIIYPQAFRVALPSLTSSFSSLLKDSSLVSILAITELTRSGQLIYTRTYRAFEIYLVVGLIYFILTTIVTVCSRIIERRFSKPYRTI